MSTAAREKVTPIEGALIRVIARAHGFSSMSVGLDRILPDLTAELGQAPYHKNVTWHLEGLRRRGILSTNGQGWHVERLP